MRRTIAARTRRTIPGSGLPASCDLRFACLDPCYLPLEPPIGLSYSMREEKDTIRNYSPRALSSAEFKALSPKSIARRAAESRGSGAQTERGTSAKGGSGNTSEYACRIYPPLNGSAPYLVSPESAHPPRRSLDADLMGEARMELDEDEAPAAVCKEWEHARRSMFPLFGYRARQRNAVAADRVAPYALLRNLSVHEGEITFAYLALAQ